MDSCGSEGFQADQAAKKEVEELPFGVYPTGLFSSAHSVEEPCQSDVATRAPGRLAQGSNSDAQSSRESPCNTNSPHRQRGRDPLLNREFPCGSLSPSPSQGALSQREGKEEDRDERDDRPQWPSLVKNKLQSPPQAPSGAQPISASKAFETMTQALSTVLKETVTSVPTENLSATPCPQPPNGELQWPSLAEKDVLPGTTPKSRGSPGPPSSLLRSSTRTTAAPIIRDRKRVSPHRERSRLIRRRRDDTRKPHRRHRHADQHESSERRHEGARGTRGSHRRLEQRQGKSQYRNRSRSRNGSCEKSPESRRQSHCRLRSRNSRNQRGRSRSRRKNRRDLRLSKDSLKEKYMVRYLKNGDPGYQSPRLDISRIESVSEMYWRRPDRISRRNLENQRHEDNRRSPSQESHHSRVKSCLNSRCEPRATRYLADHRTATDAVKARQPRVVFRRDSLCVLFKPPFVVCSQRDETVGVAAWAKANDLTWTASGRPLPYFGLCHRLDMATSGLLLVGRNHDTVMTLVNQRNMRDWRKVYVALMHGQLPAGHRDGVIRAPLTTIDEAQGWRSIVDPASGLKAETYYAALRQYKCRQTNRPFTLIVLQISTGRTHQIRVHLIELARTLGYSPGGIVGDRKYLDQTTYALDLALFQKASKRDDALYQCRVCLHAATLGFQDPTTGERIEVDSGLPPDISSIIHNCLEPEFQSSKPSADIRTDLKWILDDLDARAGQARPPAPQKSLKSRAPLHDRKESANKNKSKNLRLRSVVPARLHSVAPARKRVTHSLARSLVPNRKRVVEKVPRETFVEPELSAQGRKMRAENLQEDLHKLRQAEPARTNSEGGISAEMAPSELPYAKSGEDILVGHRVEVRDGDDDEWKMGVVSSIEAEGYIRVKPDGFDYDFRWKQCRKAPLDTVQNESDGEETPLINMDIAGEIYMAEARANIRASASPESFSPRESSESVSVSGSSDDDNEDDKKVDDKKVGGTLGAPTEVAVESRPALPTLSVSASSKGINSESQVPHVVQGFDLPLPSYLLQGSPGSSAPAPSPYAIASTLYSVGDEVEVRDADTEAWKCGVVTEIESEGFLRVTPHGFDKSFRWMQCRALAARRQELKTESKTLPGRGKQPSEIAIAPAMPAEDSGMESDDYTDSEYSYSLSSYSSTPSRTLPRETVSSARTVKGKDEVVARSDFQQGGREESTGTLNVSSSASAPYALARGIFRVGDRVEVRDAPDDTWKLGVVVEIETGDFIRAQPDGFDIAFRWKECRFQSLQTENAVEE